MSHRNPDDCDRHIGAEGTEPAGATRRRSGEAGLRELDECLDAALACTFPASDPIGSFAHHDRGTQVSPPAKD
jgi:hypothetical protein